MFILPVSSSVADSEKYILSSMWLSGAVSPSLTQFREIGSVYPGFAIVIAIGLRKPYAQPELGANLVLYNVF
jgi:hypothetical protein